MEKEQNENTENNLSEENKNTENNLSEENTNNDQNTYLTQDHKSWVFYIPL